jgi:hypothetical protein
MLNAVNMSCDMRRKVANILRHVWAYEELDARPTLIPYMQQSVASMANFVPILASNKLMFGSAANCFMLRVPSASCIKGPP